ncbi:glutamine--fructose-6-phosphate transaminase [Haloechinothrix alba]|uniref:Glutamine--fructose-6-phosphate transaminase n=1 Tax=Haloechinothrix alba TaxID=664784 RepID=A0A238VRP0_9PSEU|nr:SIS domain-containing protein [Haloechinothrix alba]SNR36169.1 glutamine--fructose-6-phosphate transaminase [Haloechinothrix alba]
MSTPPATSGEHPRGELMLTEIREQPGTLEGILSGGAARARTVASAIVTRRPRFVLLAARGTSDHAALYAKYLVEIMLGLPAGMASPSTLTTYDARPDMTGVLWIAVSQSGGSPDLVDSTAAAGRAGATTLAVTNNAESDLAATAQLHLDMRAGTERAVAATKTYTASLLTLWLLLTYVRGAPTDAAHALPERAAALLDEPDVQSVADRFRFAGTLVTTARGYAYATAREAALKLMETAYLSAHAFSGADLLHGPLAMIDQDRPVIAVIPEGAGGQAMRPVVDNVHERGAELCVLGDPSVAGGGDCVLALPAGTEEQLLPILQIVPLQRLAHTMALARGYDPDAPRGLRKETSTW